MTRLPSKTRGPMRASAPRGTPEAYVESRNGEDGELASSTNGNDTGSLKLLRFPAVRERTGLSRSTIWRLERQGAFPRHHRISAHAVAWVEDDVAKWIRSKVRGIAV